MLLINCPHCGERAQTEFAYYGEAHIARPEKPEVLSDAEWAEYVFLRTNPKGVHFERWMHAHGCRRFFNMMRDTVSGEIFVTYRIGDKKPDIPAVANAEKAAQGVNATKTATIGKTADKSTTATADNKTTNGGNKKAADDKGKTAAADNNNADNNKSTTAKGGKSITAGGDNNNADNKDKSGDNKKADDDKSGRGKE
ncbi:MAG: sarcosine oxidase subunit delta [Gammaproteobacteria bacterium]